MRYLFGYPVALMLHMGDNEVLDLSSALTINGSATGVVVDIEKVLDLIQDFEEKRG
jgi:hypothetical protein